MTRKILFAEKSVPTIEGAGVKLNRVFGNGNEEVVDPFLLMDHFNSSNPDDYLAGFPWHPHRGIETVTYMISGKVAHEDSLGNKGVIGPGDVQWMTAGSGIIHHEMPLKTKEPNIGFQLWVNLPKKDKMMAPRYRGITSKEIPAIEYSDGVKIKIISGEINKIKGPVKDLIVPIEYFDVYIKKNKEFSIKTIKKNTAFLFIYEGLININDFKHEEKTLIVFDEGDEVKIKSVEDSKFIFITGEKLKEPIAWYGPIVMNTEEEIKKAFEEYRNGTFVKKD